MNNSGRMNVTKTSYYLIKHELKMLFCKVLLTSKYLV